MPIHVVQLGPYPPPEGGISRNMLAIRDELRQRGDRCSIIATSRSSKVVDEPDVHHPRSAAALIGLLRQLDFDVLHLHIGGDVSPRVLALASSCTVWGRGRCVLTLHSGAYPETSEGRSARPWSLRGLIFRRFSQIIGVNEQIADVFRKYGVADERVSVLSPHFLAQPDEKTAVPAELADFCKEHSPLLLSVGGLEPDYDPLFQIAAMKKLLAKWPNAGLMIVGDGAMRAEVENALTECGHGDNIFLAGNVVHAVTLRLIKDADVMLRTTLFDGDAISVREALFLGTPVIATNTGKRPEGVHLIEIGDKEGLLNAVELAMAVGKKPGSASTSTRSNIEAVTDLYKKLA